MISGDTVSMNRLFSALVLIVLLLVVVAGGLFFYQNYGHPGQPSSVATNEVGPPATMPGADETAEAPSGETEKPEADQPLRRRLPRRLRQPRSLTPARPLSCPCRPWPSGPETITQYALASLPGWQSKIVTHDATTSPPPSGRPRPMVRSASTST